MKCSRNGRDFGFSPLYAENLDSSSSKTKADLLLWRGDLSCVNYYYASLLSTGKKLRETCHGELLLRFSFFSALDGLVVHHSSSMLFPQTSLRCGVTIGDLGLEEKPKCRELTADANIGYL
ncbi:hypothetical protein Tco_1449611 [Tanacetum coccineum]